MSSVLGLKRANWTSPVAGTRHTDHEFVGAGARFSRDHSVLASGDGGERSGARTRVTGDGGGAGVGGWVAMPGGGTYLVDRSA